MINNNKYAKQYAEINIWRDYLTDDRELSYKARLVGFVLAQYFRPDHPTYPSIRTLSEATALTVNPVQDGIKELIENGYLFREQKRKKGNRFISNNYQFIIHVSPDDTSFDISFDISHDTSPSDTEIKENKGNIINKEKIKKRKSDFEKIYKLYKGDKIRVVPFDKYKHRFEECLKAIGGVEKLEEQVKDYLKYLDIAHWRQKKDFAAWINNPESFAEDWKGKIQEENKTHMNEKEIIDLEEEKKFQEESKKRHKRIEKLFNINKNQPYFNKIMSSLDFIPNHYGKITFSFYGKKMAHFVTERKFTRDGVTRDCKKQIEDMLERVTGEKATFKIYSQEEYGLFNSKAA